MEQIELSEFFKRLGVALGHATSPEPIVLLQFLLREDDDEFEEGKIWGLNTYVYRVGESSVDWAKMSTPDSVTSWRYEHMHHEVLEVLPPLRKVLGNYCLPILRMD